MPSDIQKIDIFFRDPEFPKEETFSSLYKLRSDLHRCLFSQNCEDGPLLWPAAMLMLAGIDLMSSFYSGKPIDQRLCDIGQRYTLFCSECFTFEDQANDPDVLWKFRCALLHDYSINNPRHPSWTLRTILLSGFLPFTIRDIIMSFP